MDFLKRLFGGDEEQTRPARAQQRRRELSPDEQAVERYRYLLRTAPPETVEEAHAEAFAKLTPEQRGLVLQELDQTLTPAERSASDSRNDDPRSLARLATRAEIRQPGTLERTWTNMPATPGAGGVGMGVGMGGFMMSNFMGTFAGVMLGSMVANAFIGNSGFDQGSGDSGGNGGDAQEFGEADASDAGAADSGGIGDFGGGDVGGFGDFGGGDFGGGDF